MANLHRMAALLALASLGLAGASPVGIEDDPFEEERRAMRESAKRRAERDRVVLSDSAERRVAESAARNAPKAHTHSREIARRLRQEERRKAKLSSEQGNA